MTFLAQKVCRIVTEAHSLPWSNPGQSTFFSLLCTRLHVSSHKMCLLHVYRLRSFDVKNTSPGFYLKNDTSLSTWIFPDLLCPPLQKEMYRKIAGEEILCAQIYCLGINSFFLLSAPPPCFLNVASPWPFFWEHTSCAKYTKRCCALHISAPPSTHLGFYNWVSGCQRPGGSWSSPRTTPDLQTAEINSLGENRCLGGQTL